MLVLYDYLSAKFFATKFFCPWAKINSWAKNISSVGKTLNVSQWICIHVCFHEAQTRQRFRQHFAEQANGVLLGFVVPERSEP